MYAVGSGANSLNAGNLLGFAFFNDNFLTGTDGTIDGTDWGSDVKRDIMGPGEYGQSIGPYFVGSIAVSCDSVGPGDHRIYFSLAHKCSRHRICNQSEGDAGLLQFAGG